MPESIGERIRYLRKARNITQAELSDKIGYDSKSTISNIENGKPLTDDKIRLVAEALETTVAFLFGETDQFDRISQVSGSDEDKEEKELLTAFRKMSEDSRKGVIALLHAGATV